MLIFMMEKLRKNLVLTAEKKHTGYIIFHILSNTLHIHVHEEKYQIHTETQ